MKEEKVVFENKGEKIVGIFHMPDSKNPPAVIMSHGWTGNKNEHGLFINAAREFCKNGFAVLRFDFRGSGESEGKFEDINFTEEASDLKSAISFMKKQNVDRNKIGLLGLSMGAAVSVLAYNPEIRAIVLWSPAIHTKEIFLKIMGEKVVKEIEQKGYYDLHKEPHEWRTETESKISKKFLDEARSLDIPSIFKKIACPTIIIHGSNDEVVDLKFSKQLVKRGGKNRFLEIVEGADHVFNAPEHEKQVVALSLNFFKKWLK